MTTPGNSTRLKARLRSTASALLARNPKCRNNHGRNGSKSNRNSVSRNGSIKNEAILKQAGSIKRNINANSEANNLNNNGNGSATGKSTNINEVYKGTYSR